jgi:DNA-binding Xre family transcriptional regulator
MSLLLRLIYLNIFTTFVGEILQYIIMELRIKEIIKSKGLTMQEFADTLGIARVNLTKTINGNPTKDTLEKIAGALGVPVTDLFERPATDVINCPHCGGKIKMSKE